MTLIVGISTSNAALIVSDMRLSWNGVVRQDESVKAGFFRTADARVLYAYTGIAEWQSSDQKSTFNTVAWLSNAIYECSGDPSLIHVLQTLRERATTDFKSHPILSSLTKDKIKISILFLGYLHNSNMSIPISATLSNFQDIGGGINYAIAQEEFFLHITEGVKDGGTSYFLGATNAVTKQHKAELAALIAEDLPLEALRGKAHQIMEEAELSPSAAKSIGPNLMFAKLLADPRTLPNTQYHSATGGNKIHLMGMTDRASGMSIAKIVLNTLESFPGKQRRNDPCACGSGKKYKRCHGRPAS